MKPNLLALVLLFLVACTASPPLGGEDVPAKAALEAHPDCLVIRVVDGRTGEPAPLATVSYLPSFDMHSSYLQENYTSWPDTRLVESSGISGVADAKGILHIPWPRWGVNLAARMRDERGGHGLVAYHAWWSGEVPEVELELFPVPEIEFATDADSGANLDALSVSLWRDASYGSGRVSKSAAYADSLGLLPGYDRGSRSADTSLFRVAVDGLQLGPGVRFLPESLPQEPVLLSVPRHGSVVVEALNLENEPLKGPYWLVLHEAPPRPAHGDVPTEWPLKSDVVNSAGLRTALVERMGEVPGSATPNRATFPGVGLGLRLRALLCNNQDEVLGYYDFDGPTKAGQSVSAKVNSRVEIVSLDAKLKHPSGAPLAESWVRWEVTFPGAEGSDPEHVATALAKTDADGALRNSSFWIDPESDWSQGGLFRVRLLAMSCGSRQDVVRDFLVKVGAEGIDLGEVHLTESPVVVSGTVNSNAGPDDDLQVIVNEGVWSEVDGERRFYGTELRYVLVSADGSFVLRDRVAPDTRVLGLVCQVNGSELGSPTFVSVGAQDVQLQAQVETGSLEVVLELYPEAIPAEALPVLQLRFEDAGGQGNTGQVELAEDGNLHASFTGLQTGIGQLTWKLASDYLGHKYWPSSNTKEVIAELGITNGETAMPPAIKLGFWFEVYDLVLKGYDAGAHGLVEVTVSAMSPDGTSIGWGGSGNLRPLTRNHWQLITNGEPNHFVVRYSDQEVIVPIEGRHSVYRFE